MTNDSGWIMHAKLGWVFSMGYDDGNGVWLWQNNLGWLWTKEGCLSVYFPAYTYGLAVLSRKFKQTILFITTRKLIGC